MVNFLTILFRGSNEKGEGFSLFLVLRKMTAIDISTKIWRQISEPDCLSSRSDGKLLSSNAWECPMLEVGCRRLGYTDPNLSLSYSGFRMVNFLTILFRV